METTAYGKPPAPPAPETQEPQGPGTLFPNLNEWVENWLTIVYNRADTSSRTWCPLWWTHDEAVYRLDALWRSWEYTRVNDGAIGAATWLVNYGDPIMTVLTQAEGCFKGCTSEQHRSFALHPDECLPTFAQPDALAHDRT